MTLSSLFYKLIPNLLKQHVFVFKKDVPGCVFIGEQSDGFKCCEETKIDLHLTTRKQKTKINTLESLTTINTFSQKPLSLAKIEGMLAADKLIPGEPIQYKHLLEGWRDQTNAICC